jgi:hypothetical protein
VAATSDGEEKVVFPSEVDCLDYVRDGFISEASL